jgi:hypothetical protein
MSNEAQREKSTGISRLLAALRAADAHLSLPELHQLTNDPLASISANIRNLKKEKYGAHRIDRRIRSGNLWEYRLVKERRPPDAD